MISGTLRADWDNRNRNCDRLCMKMYFRPTDRPRRSPLVPLVHRLIRVEGVEIVLHEVVRLLPLLLEVLLRPRRLLSRLQAALPEAVAEGGVHRQLADLCGVTVLHSHREKRRDYAGGQLAPLRMDQKKCILGCHAT